MSAIGVLKVLGKLALCYLAAGVVVMMYGTWFTYQGHPHAPPWLVLVFMTAPFAPILLSGAVEGSVYIGSFLLFVWLAFRKATIAQSRTREA